MSINPYITVTPKDAKGSEAFDAFYTSDGKYMLSCEKDSTYAGLMYADKDVNMKGTGDYSVSYDVNLKQGWNYLTASRNSVTASKTLPSGFQWTVSDVTSTLWVNDLPSSGSSYMAIVFKADKNVSNLSNLDSINEDGDDILVWGYSYYSEGSSFDLGTWKGNGTFPVVLYRSIETGYRYTTLLFTNGTAMVNFKSFTVKE